MIIPQTVRTYRKPGRVTLAGLKEATLSVLPIFIHSLGGKIHAPGTSYWYLMSLIQGPSYPKRYFVTGNTHVVRGDPIRRVVLLPIRDILRTRIFLRSY